LLGPGDVLRVSVWRHPEFSGDFPVDPGGALVHPLYQTVKVGGLPLTVAKGLLRDLLLTYDQSVQLTVEPLWPVAVTGEVRLPSLYRLPQGTTIAQAVALAGGATERGDERHVRVIQRQGRTTVNLTRDDAATRDLAIGSGDQVVVRARSHFNFVSDLVVPLTSIMTAITSLLILSRQ
jgi:polysaccharide export outer membrane protein